MEDKYLRLKSLMSEKVFNNFEKTIIDNLINCLKTDGVFRDAFLKKINETK